MIDIEELKTLMSRWKEAVGWISKGWDCIEEYTDDLSSRESLQDLLDEFSSERTIPKEIENRLAAIDGEFISVTEKSNLCVWDCRPMFRYYDEDNIELLPLNEYDQEKYWFYYRWQPDCPYEWRDIDAETYQKKVYGLDYKNMSHDQLIEAVRIEVSRWKQQTQQMKSS